MSQTQAVSSHYTHGSLLDAIRLGVEGLGKSPATVTVEDLAPVDEFHVGGRVASEGFLSQLELSPEDHVLDVGCGLGGACRFVADRYGSRVTGIDLTPEYVEVGRALCSWVGLAHLIQLDEGSALAMPYQAGAFDKAYLMHVGMNIADKRSLISALGRVLRPGGRLGIYDLMRVGAGELAFPVPWATTPETSFVESTDEYKRALESLGFRVTAERDRRDFALDFFASLQASNRSGEGPPPLGLHILMGSARADKVKNMTANVTAGLLTPVEFIAEKVRQPG